MQTDVTVTQEARDARVARYFADHAEAAARLATFPERTRQRLKAWQTAQGEWFSDILLEIVAEFIAFDDALGEPVAAQDVAALVSALEAIAAEAERENGSWVHLKRCIAVQARTALAKHERTPHD